jgi:hypothetical protein
VELDADKNRACDAKDNAQSNPYFFGHEDDQDERPNHPECFGT